MYDSQSFIMILGTKDDEWNHVNVSAFGDGSLVNAGFKILQTLTCSPVNEATTLLKLWQQSYGYFPLLSKFPMLSKDFYIFPSINDILSDEKHLSTGS